MAGASPLPERPMSERYRIERYLTEGGMGAIYVGKRLGPSGFEKEVVLKQLLPEFTSRPEFRDLFFKEAKISATLDHANIVHTFDLVDSDGSLFIVMEYVRGSDLRTICRRARIRRHELGDAAAIHIALEVLAGLGYAHARVAPDGTPLEIIHRDVSPSNILCSVQGEVKLSDFGIARASNHSSVFYRVRGKVGYMSPEQARNESLDRRTDLYSLAVCLYETLAGERLFVGDLSTPPEEIYSQPVPAITEKRPGLPQELDTVLLKGLAPRAEDRFQDAAEFAEALRGVAHRYGLLYSAPQLAQHLSEILGANTDRWLHEDTQPPLAPHTDRIPLSKPNSLEEVSRKEMSPKETSPKERSKEISMSDKSRFGKGSPLADNLRGQDDAGIPLTEDEEEPTTIHQPSMASSPVPSETPGPALEDLMPTRLPSGSVPVRPLSAGGPPRIAAPLRLPGGADPGMSPAPDQMSDLLQESNSAELAGAISPGPASPAPVGETSLAPPPSFSFEEEAEDEVRLNSSEISLVERIVPAMPSLGAPSWTAALVLLAASLLGAGAAHLVTRGDIAAITAAAVVGPPAP